MTFGSSTVEKTVVQTLPVPRSVPRAVILTVALPTTPLRPHASAFLGKQHITYSYLARKNLAGVDPVIIPH